TMDTEKFKAISYCEAINLKNEKSGVFFKSIPYNNANVYELNDSSYLILPLNPYTTALILYGKEELTKILTTNDFPVKEKLNAFYEANKTRIDNLDTHGQGLLAELEAFLTSNNFNYKGDSRDVDTIYNFLKTKKALTKYKLNFIVFVANYIIKHY